MPCIACPRRIPSGLPLPPEGAGPAGGAPGAPGGGPGAGAGEARGPMTLLEGQEDTVELEKSNVLLLGPTGEAPLRPP